ALAGLVLDLLEDDLGGEVFEFAADDHRVDRDGADRDGRGAEDRGAALVEVAAGGEVHHRVGPPLLGPAEFFDFLVGGGGDGGGAHVGVDFGLGGAADGHGVEA